MALIHRALSDPALLIAIASLAPLYRVLGNPLKDGYNVNTTDRVRDWEEFYVLLLMIPLSYIFAWITSMMVRSGFEVVPFLRIDLWTFVYGVLVGGVLVPAWYLTLDDESWTSTTSIASLSGLFVAAMFGVSLGITVVVALHPNPETIRFLFQRHVNLVIHILGQFQALLGLQIPVIQPLIDHTVGIYINNGMLAVKAGLLGALGGLVAGLLIPVGVLIMGMNAALVFGVFTGLLIRNTIAIGQPITAAPIAYLSSLGLLMIGHTFHEFMAIILVGVGAGFVTYGFVKSQPQSSKAGATIVGVGFIQLAYAAFVEVWLDPRFINFVKGYITIEPDVVPLSIKSTWLIGAISVIGTTLLVVYVLAWTIRETVKVIEGQ